MSEALTWSGWLVDTAPAVTAPVAARAPAGEPRVGAPSISTEAPLEALVRRAQGGDRAAFGALVERLQEPLYFAVLRMVRHPQDARDVVQRSFLRAWTQLGTLGEAEKFRGWLFSVALNQARNHVRDEGRRRHEPIEEGTLVTSASAPALLERREEQGQLREALEALSPRQREVVTLRIDAELSFREIGEAVGCNEATARVNFHHGLKRLRELMQGEAP
jgi:RNA polymerase sigma-70 factor (ECF subfamily)